MFNYPPTKPSFLTEIKNFSGLNTGLTASQIADNEACLMENFYISNSGKLVKRLGWKSLLNLEANSINSMYVFNGRLLLACGTKIYEYKNDNTKTILYDGIANTRVLFFEMNDKLYIKDGIKYLEYDGINFVDVLTKPYVPTLFQTSVPSGSGAEVEQWNLIGDNFKQLYSGTGTDKVYKMCFDKLASVDKVIVDAKELVLTTDYTVDLTKGEITFVVAPSKGTDNVSIQASKIHEGDYKQRILRATLFTNYGGNNDTRVLLAYGSVLYRSGVLDPTYWPENYYQVVGNTDEDITGFSKQYDYCVILKEKSIWHTRFENGLYPVKPLNDSVGCINTNSIQLIENAPFFLDSKGIYTINQTNVRDERNVEMVSQRVNYANILGQIGFMDENGLSYGVTCDFDRKYMYCINNKIYIFDYANNCWYKWTNINAKCFIEWNGKLYWGDFNGNLCTFKDKEEQRAYDDINVPVKATWKSKIFDFGQDEKLKLVERIYFSMNTARRTSVTINYYTQDNEKIFVDMRINDLFDYRTIDYSRFCYTATTFPVENMEKIKAKKIVYFQIEFTNSEPNDSLEILSLDIKYKVQKYVK